MHPVGSVLKFTRYVSDISFFTLTNRAVMAKFPIFIAFNFFNITPTSVDRKMQACRIFSV